jgi:hypothetical protein
MERTGVPEETTRTTQHYLAGIGAGGALLACALVAVLSLVGGTAASDWPKPGAADLLEVVELQAPPALVLPEADELAVSIALVPAVIPAGAAEGPGRDGARPEVPNGPAGFTDVSAPPRGGNPPSDAGAGALTEVPAAPPENSRQERDDEDGIQLPDLEWTPVPDSDRDESPAGLSFPSGPEEGHDDTSWTNEDG